MEEAEDAKRIMWNLDQIDQPLGDEATQVQSMQSGEQKLPASVTLRLAFLSLGVVYGDLGTSPLYVFSNTFSDGIRHREDVVGALSLVMYSITLIALVKYVLIALSSDDNGEGGTFALYSLICRHVKVNTIPNQHHTDKELKAYSYRSISENSHAFKVKKLLEKSVFLQKLLLVLVLLGTSMVIGDGALSPAISVLSAVQGLRVSHLRIAEGPVLVLAVVILVVLFSMQRFGTAKVGFMFAPIIFLWFISIFAMGIYNIVVHDPTIFRALNPLYIVRYFTRLEFNGWVSLGGVVLAVTGAEALFADLGHFTGLSIQLAFTTLVFPCLMIAYMGQAAYLMKHPEDVSDVFYSSIPNNPFVYWPMFVIATAAAVIASQATISATFSIVKQAVALGCFPRVKIVHTSNRFLGQIYIPEVNWTLMLVCLFVTAGFRETSKIGNAYGVAVVLVMLVTTLLLALVMLLIWQRNLLLILSFLLLFGFVESIYISAVLFKVEIGGWVPLAIGAVLLSIMYSWHYGCVQRYEFEMQNKVSIGWLLQLGPGLGMVRLPGIGLFYTELAHGVPSIFSHFLTHFPAIHAILIFVCVKYLPVSTVAKEERFHIRRLGPKQFRMYRCAVRYGYKDLHKKDDHFDEMLLQTLAASIRYESLVESVSQATDEDTTSSATSSVAAYSEMEDSHHSNNDNNNDNNYNATNNNNNSSSNGDHISMEIFPTASSIGQLNARSYDGGTALSEAEVFNSAREEGIVHILGNTAIRTREGAPLFKRVIIDYMYSFLRRICRGSSVVYHIPQESMLHVGMVYRV